MGEWVTKKLKEIAIIKMGQSPESLYVNEVGIGVPFLQGNAEFSSLYPKNKYWVIKPTRVSKTEDILLSVRAPVGETNIADREYCIGRGLSSIEFHIDKKFGWYLINKEKRQLKVKERGSTFTAVNKKDIETIDCFFPEEKIEQSKIAEILTTIDDAIEKTERIIAKYRRIKQGLLQDLLTKGIDENGNIRSEATHKFKDSPLGRIPVEWKVESISSILVNKEGAIKVGPFGSQLRKDELCENGYKVYGQENAFYKDFNIGKRYINKSKFKQLKSCELLSGDFIISMMGTIGRCAIVPNDIEKGIMDSHLIRLRIKNYNLKLLIYLIEDYHLTKQQIKNMSVGGIMEGLNSKVIKQILIPVPPSKEQEMIVSLLDCCLNVINYEESILNKLKSIKQGLMQDLLSGKVRVTHLLK